MAQSTNTSRTSINFLRQRPFLTFFCGLLSSKHFENDLTNIRILEVGIGSGEFLVLLKDEFPAVTIVGIDLNEDAMKGVPQIEGVTLKNVGFLDYKDEEKFDVVLFTKSMHHILPLDKTVLHAYELLKPKGFLVAEEFDRDAMDPPSARWFIDRLELVAAAGSLIPSMIPHHHGHGHQESHQAHHHGHLEGQEHQDNHQGQSFQHRLAKMFDSSIPPIDRWKEILPPLPAKKEVVETLTSQFGLENTRVVDTIPFLYNFLSISGLEDNPKGWKIFSTFLCQEETAIKEGILTAIGLNIVAEKSA